MIINFFVFIGYSKFTKSQQDIQTSTKTRVYMQSMVIELSKVSNKSANSLWFHLSKGVGFLDFFAPMTHFP